MKPTHATWLLLNLLHWIGHAVYAARTQTQARHRRQDLLEEWWRDRKLANSRHARAAAREYLRIRRRETTPTDIIIDP
jgi:hypothetical protein